ncbi:fimbrial protein [Pantoea ananatis]|uniref:fimbrial protein n=1 Tax=Pantoea ananas TaxID=553 RepID=UPI0024AD5B33|nr:fimbrial protein [Pantoea ananatis]MDI6539111.1 fimbrial protein [Pantoea ananatis]
MKNTRIPLCLLACVLLLTGRADAADSTITVTAYVRDNMCRVATPMPLTVDLKQTASKQLFRPGEVSPGPAQFSIELNPCGASAVGVKAGFTGTADPDNNTLLQIDSGTGAATGAGIQILDSNMNPIPLNAASATLSWTPLTAGQSNTLLFYARLMATRNPVTTGTVNASASLTLEFQ